MIGKDKNRKRDRVKDREKKNTGTEKRDRGKDRD